LIDAGAKVRPPKRPGRGRPQYPGGSSSSSSDAPSSDDNQYLSKILCFVVVVQSHRIVN